MSSSSSLCPACYECPAPTTAAGVWPEIEAITKDANKTAATITITYSFIQAGTLANDHSAGGAATCVEIKDYFDSSVTNANFKQEIIDAFQVWKDGFKEACPWLTFNLVTLNEIR